MVTVTGGDRLTAYLSDLSKKVQRKSVLKAGFLEGAKYEDGTPVALVAAVQNFGNPAAGIPARPFMNNAVSAHGGDWGDALGQLLVANGYDAGVALEQLGEIVRFDIQEAIIDLDSPPLSPLTLQARQWKADNPGKTLTKGILFGRLAAQLRKGPPDVGGVSSKPLIEPNAGNPEGGHMLASVDFEVD